MALHSYEEILNTYWGFENFRPLQQEIIESIGNQKDTIALLPTGGGKSICYQVPGMASNGLCLVISPLIALMNDQVENLKKKGIKAISVTSALSSKEIDIALDNAAYGDYKFLYISPERLQTNLFQERLLKMNINVIAVDEAHCISQWGYDFRPAYLNIASIREIKPETPIIALTASATDKVVEDIKARLGLRSPELFKKSFTRKNLAYVVLREESKERKLLDILNKVKGSSIVYVRSRKQSKVISSFLRDNGISADYYHAGLSNQARNEKQKAWMNNLIRVIVSTNAFGIGIDKADVRTVIHFDLCENPENYYQEAGRAGRDGKKAYAVQLFNDRDIALGEIKINNQFPDRSFIESCYDAIGKHFNLAYGSGSECSFPFELNEFVSRYNFPVLPAYYALKILERNNYLILNEVDYQNSRIKILVDNTSIYDYQLRNEKYAALINVLLRSYAHLFDEYVGINERELAKRLQLNYSEIIKQLQFLNKLELVDYRARNEGGSIYFVQPRVPKERIFIDKNTFSIRKSILEEKWANMKAYLSNVEYCRSKLLVSFFDENDAKNCGICDVCLERKKINLSTNEFRHLLNEIKDILEETPLEIDELSELMKHRKNDELLSVIRWLNDQNTIQLRENKLHWKQN
ncbi:MAG: ATP-dependent DNA helicase RecQ [Bacteroidota bacterium]